MALEASDLSDGAILEGTQQFQNGNGQVQFKIVLPSGRELESEWLQPDMKKKAMVAWLDVVKAEAMSDADQARTDAREAAMKARNAELLAQRETQEVVSTDSPISSSTTNAPTAMTPTFNAQSATAAPTAVSASPDAFVEAGLKAAQADYTHWNDVALDAMERALKARENIDKWTSIKRSLEGHEQSNSGGSPGASNNSSGTGPKRNARKKRVSKSTDFQELDVSIGDVRGT